MSKGPVKVAFLGGCAVAAAGLAAGVGVAMIVDSMRPRGDMSTPGYQGLPGALPNVESLPIADGLPSGTPPSTTVADWFKDRISSIPGQVGEAIDNSPMINVIGAGASWLGNVIFSQGNTPTEILMPGGKLIGQPGTCLLYTSRCV